MSKYREDFLKALAEVAQVKAVHLTPRQWSGGPLTQEQVDVFVETTLQNFRDEDWIDHDFIRKAHEHDRD